MELQKLWLCSGRLTLAGNVLGIKEGGMVNGAMSRKVEITLNSAVSLVQTLQPLLFIPCYKSGCGELRGVTRRSRNAFELQLAYNGLQIGGRFNTANVLLPAGAVYLAEF